MTITGDGDDDGDDRELSSSPHLVGWRLRRAPPRNTIIHNTIIITIENELETSERSCAKKTNEFQHQKNVRDAR